MKNFRHFFSKLACALVAILTIGSAITPVADNPLTNWPSQTVYAKKAKKKKSKKSKKKHVAVATSWRWKKPTASVYIDLNDNQ